MEQGILMEVRGRQGILLTGTGEFRRVDLGAGRWQIGEEVTAPLVRSGRPWLRTVVAAAAAFLILFGGPTGYWQWSLAQPSVVLAMEINPTVEFVINGRGKVIEARGLNADGEALLEGTDWRNLPVDQVVRTAVDKAVAMGKLDPASAEGAIVVTLAPVKGEQISEAKVEEIITVAQAAGESAVQEAAVAKGKQPQAQIATTPATKSEVEQARAEGLTLPEYKLYKSLQETHPDLKPEDFEKKGPGAVLKELGILPAEVLPSIGKGHGKDDPPGHDQNDDRGNNQGNDRQGDDKSNSKNKSGSDDKSNVRSNPKSNVRPDDKSNGRNNDQKDDKQKGEGKQNSSSGGQNSSQDDSTNGGASDNRGGATGARGDEESAAGAGNQGSDSSADKGGKGSGSASDKGKGSDSASDKGGKGSDSSSGKGRPDDKEDKPGQGSNSGSGDDRSEDEDEDKGRDKDNDEKKSGKGN